MLMCTEVQYIPTARSIVRKVSCFCEQWRHLLLRAVTARKNMLLLRPVASIIYVPPTASGCRDRLFQLNALS